MNIKRRFLLSVASVLSVWMSPVWAGNVIYVDDDAPLGGDGRSWQTAYRYLQDGLTEAKMLVAGVSTGSGSGGRGMLIALNTESGLNSDPCNVEIRVAQGIYKPDQGSGQTLGDRRASFELGRSIALKGGYAGMGALDPNARDIELYETILSGDLAGDDVVVTDPCDLEDEPSRAENSYHVVEIQNADDKTLLEGFSVIGGYAWVFGGPVGDNYSEYNGGGVRCRDSEKITIAKCAFKANFAWSGGGIFNGSSVRMIECMFIMNAASTQGGEGGGMYNNGKPVIEKCIFMNNWGSGGGAVHNYSSEASISNCSFNNNSTSGEGGGVSNTGANNIHFISCIFIGNSTWRGGAMMNHGSNASLSLSNCLFVDNIAQDRGGAVAIDADVALTMSFCTSSRNMSPMGCFLSCDSFQGRYPSDIRIHSSILWDGNEPIWNGDNSSIVLTYSDVLGGWSGVGNIDADPLFADPNNGNYHLKSQGGRWDSKNRIWIQDYVTSPCIDSGYPNSPIMYEPFSNGGRINMGAYGGTAEASKSYFGRPPCETVIAGDINGDCRVDCLDLAILASHWLEEYVPPNTLNTYRFLPEESSVVAYCGRGGIKNYSIEGEFRLTINPLEGEFLFYDVNAVLDDDLLYIDVEGLTSSRNLDIIFHMRDLQVIDVGETQISCVFRKGIPSYPNADVLAKVVFEGDSVSLTGTFYDIAKDRCWYQLTAKAILK